MSAATDGRVPVRIGPPAPAGQGCAVLAEAGVAIPGGPTAVFRLAPALGHAGGCACCRPRAAVAAALHALFQDRAHGRVAHFDRVLACPAGAAGAAAIRAALSEDAFLAARYRLEA